MLGLGQTSNFSWDKLNLVVFKFMKSSTSGSVKFVWISLDRDGVYLAPRVREKIDAS